MKQQPSKITYSYDGEIGTGFKLNKLFDFVQLKNRPIIMLQFC